MKKVFTLLAAFVLLLNTQIQAQQWDSIVSGIPLNPTLGNVLPSFVDIFPVNNQVLLASGSGALYRSTDQGNSWSTLPFIYSPTGLATNSYNSFLKVADNRILAMGVGGFLANAISKSDDDGATWVASFTGIDPSSNGNVSIEGGGIAPDGTIYIVSRQNGGVYASTDNGDTWIEKAVDISDNLWSIHVIDNSTIVVGASVGIFRSTDGGTTWSQVLDTTSSTDYVVSIKSNSVGTLYAGVVSGFVRKSIDGGESWTSTALSNASSMVNSIEIDNEDNIYVGIYLGGVTKFNSAEIPVAVFATQSNGLANTRVMDFAIDASGDEPVYYIACDGTTGTGGCLYRSGGNAISNIAEVSGESISLYPNPTIETLMISGLDTSSQWQFNVFTLEGKLAMSQPWNEASIQVAELSSGSYIAQLKNSDGEIHTLHFVKR